MRALVTGSSGFLGGHLTDALLARGDFVVGLSRDQTDQAQAGVTRFIRCKNAVLVFGSFETVERALAEYEIDTVFHLAAQTQVSTAKADPIGTLETNVRGTWRVLEACRRQKVRRIIVASSDKVYGSGTVPYIEDQPVCAHGIYATSKACADLIAQSYFREYGLSMAIVRCGNLYGPRHTNWSAIVPGTIRSVIRGERPVIRSDGSPRRDYLFVDDAVAGYLTLADSDNVGAWNFGTGNPISVLDMVREVLSTTGSKLEPDVCGGALDEISDQWLDSSKAERLLGWRAKYDLRTGLSATVPWYREYLR